MLVTTTTLNHAPTIVDVTPEQLQQWLDAGETVLVDVREDFEHSAERIEGARHVALAKIDTDELRRMKNGHRIVFHCRTGKRSLDAARRFARDEEPAFHLAGGIEAWKTAGHQTRRSATAPKIDVMRQVQMTSGSLVLAGVVLGWLVSPWFLALSAFVGAGLFFAGASGWCGMAKLLSRMPWNRTKG
ncbi:MAG: rhodanese-like domain-containing protein [Planctomycetes bacterium]|nr:rhodanese-like domain-containing protein [Planctomycetota bacterium]